jgi:hypothetical protein
MTTVMPKTRRFCRIFVMIASKERATPRAAKWPDQSEKCLKCVRRSSPSLCPLTRVDRLSATSPSLGATAHVVTDSPRLRRPSYQASCIRQPGSQFIVILCQAISKSTKASQGGCPPEYCTVARLWHIHSSIRF